MPTPGEPQPVWWNPSRRLAHLGETTQQVADRLAERLLRLPDHDEALPPSDSTELELVWTAGSALRDAITDAAAAGASPECVAALHGRLDRELRRLTTGVTHRLAEEQRELLEGVSHDIRSPLNSILFLADALLNEHSGELNPNQRRQIGVVYGAAVALVRLVNDLIDFARLTEGTALATRTVDFRIDAVLEDVQRLLAPLLSHQNVKLRVRNEIRTPRTGDPQLVSRLMINLLTNGIDAAAEGGAVEVLFRDGGEERLRIEVVNTGEPPDLDELRSRLDGHPSERALRGRGWTHGLGLSISSRLVRAARGTMCVDCPTDGRTRFTVELPFPPAPGRR